MLLSMKNVPVMLLSFKHTINKIAEKFIYYTYLYMKKLIKPLVCKSFLVIKQKKKLKISYCESG